MSSVIKLELKPIENNSNSADPEINLHYMPFKIDDNEKVKEKINIRECFEAYTQEVDGVLHNAVRGYPLKGCKMNVPANYKGIIFLEKRKPLNEDADRTFTGHTIFDSFTYWNYDRIPSVNDPLQKAFGFIEIAETIHSPANPTEFEAYANAQQQKQNCPKQPDETETIASSSIE